MGRADGVDFVIENGKVKYDNFKLYFTGGLELNFHGSVGLADDSMDLYVGVPLQAPLLKELGILNMLGERASLLSDTRIDIPLAGSSKAPKLNLAGVNVQEILKKSGQKVLESPGSILDSILKPKPTETKPAVPQGPSAPQTAPPSQTSPRSQSAPTSPSPASPAPQEPAPAAPAVPTEPAPAQPGASTEPGTPAAPAPPAAPAAPEVKPAEPTEEQPKTEAPKDKRSESKRKSTRKKDR